MGDELVQSGHGRQDLGALFDTWLYQPGKPRALGD